MTSLRVRESAARPPHPEPQQDETAVEIPPSRRKPRQAQADTVQNAVGKAFAKGYLSDEHIASIVQRNFCCILFCAFCALLACLGWAYRFRLSVIARSRASIHPRTRFCNRNPNLCQHAAYFKSVLYDYRKTRDAQLNPSGYHTQFEAEHFKEATLRECAMPCEITQNATDAHVMIGMFNAPDGVRRRERLQKAAVVTLEAHSMSREALAGADLLVSFHAKSDVRVNYFYSLRHGVPCTDAAGDCLHAVQDALGVAGAALRQTGGVGGSKRRKAAMFVSNKCDRHGNFLKELLDHLARDVGVDSYGQCFHNAEEADHPLYVGDNAERSKELISGSYKFHLVAENALVEDYVSEKFFEGLKAGSLMVYLGAPNARQYAPAPNSFVDAQDFAGPEELAAHIVELDRNSSRYQSYFTWRSDPAGPSPEFRALSELDLALPGRASWQCRLCEAFVNRFCPK